MDQKGGNLSLARTLWALVCTESPGTAKTLRLRTFGADLRTVDYVDHGADSLNEFFGTRQAIGLIRFCSTIIR